MIPDVCEENVHVVQSQSFLVSPALSTFASSSTSSMIPPGLVTRTSSFSAIFHCSRLNEGHINLQINNSLLRNFKDSSQSQTLHSTFGTHSQTCYRRRAIPSRCLRPRIDNSEAKESLEVYGDGNPCLWTGKPDNAWTSPTSISPIHILHPEL